MGQPRARGESSRALGADDGPLRRRVGVVGEVAAVRRDRGVRRRPAATASRRSALGARCRVGRRRSHEPVQGSVRPRSARLGESGNRGAGGDARVGVIPLGAYLDRVCRGDRGGRLLPSPALAAHRSGVAGRALANLPRSPLRAGCSRGSSAGDRARSPGRVGNSSPPRIARPIRYESTSGRNELVSEP